jgi:hypothetical protein
MMVTQSLGRASSPSEVSSSPVSCYAGDLRKSPKSVARIKPQYAANLGLQIISRAEQGPMSSPSQCHSLIALLQLPAGQRAQERSFIARQSAIWQTSHVSAAPSASGGNIASRRWLQELQAEQAHSSRRAAAAVPCIDLSPSKSEPPRQPSRHSRAVGEARGHHGCRLKRLHWGTGRWVE